MGSLVFVGRVCLLLFNWYCSLVFLLLLLLVCCVPCFSSFTMHLYFTCHLFWVTTMNLEQLVAICAFTCEWVTYTVNTIFMLYMIVCDHLAFLDLTPTMMQCNAKPVNQNKTVFCFISHVKNIIFIRWCFALFFLIMETSKLMYIKCKRQRNTYTRCFENPKKHTFLSKTMTVTIMIRKWKILHDLLLD